MEAPRETGCVGLTSEENWPLVVLFPRCSDGPVRGDGRGGGQGGDDKIVDLDLYSETSRASTRDHRDEYPLVFMGDFTVQDAELV